MGRNAGLRLSFIAALTLLGLYAWGPNAANPLGHVVKGLDLAGGAELVYRIRIEDLPEAQRDQVLVQAAGVVRKRLGVLSEATVSQHGADRILVKLPHADQQTVEDLKAKIRKSGRLEWRLVVDETSDRPDLFRRARLNRQKGLPPPPGVRWYEVLGDKGARDEVLVDDRVEMAGDAVDPARIRSSQDEEMRDAISLGFTDAGNEAFNRIAKKCYPKRRVAVILNDQRALPTEEERARDAGAPGQILEQGVCYSALGFRSDHFEGGALISGSFTQLELQNLMDVFRSGSLPAPLELERQMQVGPSLGEDQLLKGQRACLWGAALVILFMAAYYLLPGAVAALALLLNLVLLLGVMGAFGATLTLPGMAGIVLTLGMAVDANVLIFERIREELAAGKPLGKAVEAGYDRAFVTIFDSNVTTVISAVVLYAMGSEQVKGFAVTLAIGLLVSLFTSVVVTRAVFDLLMAKGWMKAFRALNLLPATAIDFVRPAGLCMAGSAVLLLGGLAHMALRGKQLLAVDFTGGRILQVRFVEGRPISEVRRQVLGLLPDAQIQSLLPPGGGKGEPRDFEIITRRMDLDADRVRDEVRRHLGPALSGPLVELPDAADGRLVFEARLSAPREAAGVEQALQPSLPGVRVEGLGETQLRISVAPRYVVEELRRLFAGMLAPSAFRREAGGRPAHSRVSCGVRDLTREQVLARLSESPLGMPGCAVTLGAPDARGIAPVTIESPIQDVEEVKRRLLRHFGPELCLQDVPYAKIHPDGSSDVEIRLASPMTLEEIASRQVEIRKQLGLELGSAGKATELSDPNNPSSPVKGLLMNYKSGMKDLKQYLNFVRANLPLVDPFREAVSLPATARLTFSLMDAGKGMSPAERVAKEVDGTLADAALIPNAGGFHATIEVPVGTVGKAESLLRRHYAESLSDPFPRDDVVGGVVADEAVSQTGWALVAAWAALILYMAFRFEFISGVAAVVALVHDALFTLGVVSVTGVQIDLTIVAAVLTIIGFSVNDTIVIFDRIRENLGGKWGVSSEQFAKVVNLSVNQTLSRTLLTSLTVFLAVASLFMGGEVFQGFGIAMLAGVVSGTYSTVYIAAPLVQLWRRRESR